MHTDNHEAGKATAVITDTERQQLRDELFDWARHTPGTRKEDPADTRARWEKIKAAYGRPLLPDLPVCLNDDSREQFAGPQPAHMDCDLVPFGPPGSTRRELEKRPAELLDAHVTKVIEFGTPAAEQTATPMTWQNLCDLADKMGLWERPAPDPIKLTPAQWAVLRRRFPPPPPHTWGPPDSSALFSGIPVEITEPEEPVVPLWAQQPPTYEGVRFGGMITGPPPRLLGETGCTFIAPTTLARRTAAVVQPPPPPPSGWFARLVRRVFGGR